MAAARITVDNRIRVPLGDLPAAVADELRAAFTHENKKYEKLVDMRYPVGNETPLIRTWRHEPGPGGSEVLALPRGGMARVRAVLERAGIGRNVRDARVTGSLAGSFAIPDHLLKLRDYQERLVARGIERENCLWRAPTGCGKTTAAFGLIARVKLPSLIVVWLGDLHDQWVERLQTEMGMRKADIGIVRGSKFNIKPVTVAMQQTLASRGIEDALAEYFGLCLYDEVQRFAAPSLFDCVDPFAAKYRVGVSADERRKDGKEFLIYDLFGDVAEQVDQKTLIANGDVLDVQVCVVPTEFDAPWYRFRQDFDELVGEMAADASRNDLALRYALQEARAGEPTALLTLRVEHCRHLDRAMNVGGVLSGVMIGGQENRAESRRTKVRFKDGELRAIAGTLQAIGVGTDFPSMSRGVITMPFAGNKQQWGQARGRFCRAPDGKNGARIYYLWDRLVYGRRHLENLRKWNNDVVVLEPDGTWTAVKEYLARMTRAKAAEQEVEHVFGK